MPGKFTLEKQQSPRWRWCRWDWIVATWGVLILWLGDVAQWVLANIIPNLKHDDLSASFWTGLLVAVVTLLIRLARNNQNDKNGAIFPITPPPVLVPPPQQFPPPPEAPPVKPFPPV